MNKYNKICLNCKKNCKQWNWVDIIYCPSYSPINDEIKPKWIKTKRTRRKKDKVEGYEYKIGDKKLHVLVYSDNKWFIAHCLEMDLVAQGDSPEKAIEELESLIKDRIDFATEKKWEKYLFKSAPDKYWAMYWKLRKKNKGGVE